jgi:hypothetical protein
LPSLDDSFVRRADVLARDIPEGAVLVDMMSGQCWELNRIGAALWSLLESPVSLRQVCDVLLTRYEADADTVQRDVMALATDLARAGLVVTPR